MIQMNFETSSTTMIPISDFHYIYELARCSKCQNFIVLKQTNTLYGFPNDCSCIHEIHIPFKVNTDLTFGFESIKKEILQNTSFFIPSKFSWFILPDKYWEAYINNELIYEYDPRANQYILLDKEGQPIEYIPMSPYRVEINYVYQKMITQLEGFFNRFRTLTEPCTFTNMQNHNSIRYIYDNKISIGRSLVRLTNENIDVAFYMFKSLFSLAKSDSLDIDIRFDRFQNSQFMATFKPKKKRNPMTLNTYGVPFVELIHCMYVNICM